MSETVGSRIRIAGAKSGARLSTNPSNVSHTLDPSEIASSSSAAASREHLSTPASAPRKVSLIESVNAEYQDHRQSGKASTDFVVGFKTVDDILDLPSDDDSPSNLAAKSNLEVDKRLSDTKIASGTASQASLPIPSKQTSARTSMTAKTFPGPVEDRTVRFKAGVTFRSQDADDEISDDRDFSDSDDSEYDHFDNRRSRESVSDEETKKRFAAL